MPIVRAPTNFGTERTYWSAWTVIARPPSGSGRFGMPFDICQSSIGQRRRRACRYSDESGATATGFPTARSSGRSEYESAYA